MERPENISIIGAGPAGFALAADLQRRGRDVLIYSHPDRLRHANKIKNCHDGHHHLRVSGPKTEPYSVKLRVTCDMTEAVSFASIIILTVPSTAQESILQELKGSDLRGHIIIAVPGNLFALIAAAEMQVGCILETNLSPYSCRMSDDGELSILGKKEVVYIAPFTRKRDTPAQVYNTVTDIFSMVRLNWCSSIIEVCLANVNGIFHPLMMLMNAGRIESTGGDFLLYRDGLTPSVSNAMVAIDKVRMAIAEAFGIGKHGQKRVESAIEISNACYSQGFTCLVDLGRNSPPHNRLKAPETMDNRNLSEDVPDLLVCWCSLAEKLGIDASPIRAVIVFAEMATGVEYFKKGRNMSKLNLEHVSPDEILRRFSPDAKEPDGIYDQQVERMELIGSRL
ncbi:6-phosphogluconate dehydrogenase C-terminal domain-like protein [Naviculisporaceae sp. PSN 640]